MTFSAFSFRITCFCLLLAISTTACNDADKLRTATLQAVSDSLTSETQALRKENALLLETVGERLMVGFEVQIGAFEHFDINAYDSELLRLQEIREEGMNKYVLGRFRKFSDAQAFLTDMKKMGLEDAFIAGIVDGQRSTVAAAKQAARQFYGD
ncbi:MAG: hypothetical protein AB8H47_02405 [Bacteroidia bacterium]